MEISTKGKYYGQKDAELSFNEILLSQYDYHEAGTPWHYHENPYFMFVLHGNMIDTNSRVKTLLPAGSLMFNNWQESHYGTRHSCQAGGFHLEFEKSWFDKIGINLDLLEGSQLIENPQIHFLYAQLYREFTLVDDYSELSIEVLLLQICEGLIAVKEAHQRVIPPWVKQLKAILHEAPPDLNLKFLSEQLDVHPVHISRSAPKYLATNLGEYIRQVKLKKALPLLLNSQFSLTQIAYQAGFADQSHFHRVFKSYFHQSPGQFRKNLKPKGVC
ncbi:MAG: helix-turn-helix transcriptional regulator [Bacteroidota bacterium]